MSNTNTDFLLAIEDLTVSFDGFKAVDSFNLYIDKGELRVIIGPNGAGKTTVLDMICGKTKSTQGSIKFKNKELTKLREHKIVRAGVGRKFQTPSIYENLTVFENLEISYPWGRTVIGSLMFKRDQKVLDSIHKVAEQIYLIDDLDKQAEFLSHGQKQWLEIGMLLVQKPELILLDEPVAGMSVKEREATAALLNEIVRDRAVIIIEHDMDFVAQIAKKVTVLHMGKIIAEGTMDQVQNNEKVKEVYLGH
ncbi:urea ABC transporter ATP-binding protein UrtD [Rubritalea profundi]|uniref:Urea ABC transporter ATP-binding protein UrtD n=1 Tax=Rubritalea profundi TaxID=1658618 RepID=A0A2S7TWV9_9BACT|nr:urea ABC transporter ATP-binding protein UrtD [Rubritalea profundi]PQJ27189.1 urea ABC transporter ATP-binding protein UrtD [Rubritalea profundi]